MPASNSPSLDGVSMIDPFAMPQMMRKERRICANPLCGKALANLNKEALCFGCHDEGLLKRAATQGWIAGGRRIARSKTL